MFRYHSGVSAGSALQRATCPGEHRSRSLSSRPRHRSLGTERPRRRRRCRHRGCGRQDPCRMCNRGYGDSEGVRGGGPCARRGIRSWWSSCPSWTVSAQVSAVGPASKPVPAAGESRPNNGNRQLGALLDREMRCRHRSQERITPTTSVGPRGASGRAERVYRAEDDTDEESRRLRLGISRKRLDTVEERSIFLSTARDARWETDRRLRLARGAARPASAPIA